ncbi:MAG: hypothetical protein KGS72_14055 [Cyanobacteria bacterium REEB67]|nr:hypothetical protein [Cyanobacteria bacterium REEB67]
MADSSQGKSVPASPITTSPLDAPSVAPAAKKELEQPSPVTYSHKLPTCLSEIAAATVIEDGTLRSARSRETLLAAEKLGPTEVDTLEEMVEKATPAGRLLSLALLRKMKIAPARYQKLADNLNDTVGDQSVSYISPSERCHYSVADILNDMASSQPLIKMLP